MLFRTIASIAALAVSASASAKPQPYKLMPVTGMSLVRRQTSGYIPEETVCGDGNTCAEACGSGYTQCPSKDDAIHCFNPEAQQACCADGTGNSCEAGYYCTHDTSLQTWCCPDAMDLAECAAAYSVTGGLETIASTSVSPSSTGAPVSSTPAPTPITTTPVQETSTPIRPTGSNSTITGPTSGSSEPTSETTSTSIPTAAGAVSGVSVSLLLAAAGFVALL